MVTPEIISYIKVERAKNTPDSVIKMNLSSNGWSERDIIEAMSSLSISTVPGLPQSTISSVELKKYRRRQKWQLFFLWVVIDALLIFIISAESSFKTFGLFGASPYSIIARLVVIYGGSYFAASTSRPENTKTKESFNVILRVFTAGVIMLLLGLGVFFATCLFAPQVFDL